MRRRKIRKFADKQSSTQTKNISNTEATLILCGYSGERANNRGDSTIKEEVRRRKMRKFASKQTRNTEQSSKQADGSKTIKKEVRRRKMRKFADKQTDKEQRINGSNTEATLILCGYSGERANNRGDSTIKEEVRRRKMRKFADTHTSKEQSSRQRTVQTLRPL